MYKQLVVPCSVIEYTYLLICIYSYNNCNECKPNFIIKRKLNKIKRHNLSVTDHSLTITKTDGKTIPSQVNKTAAPTAVAAKVKGAKRDVVDRETLQLVETQLDHVTKGFDAVSVLFQYLVNDVSTTC